MAGIVSGLDALELLKEPKANKFENKFSSLKVGQTRTVKVINFGDFEASHAYSIFGVVNTFIPEQAPKLSDRGYPIGDLTPFDKVWKHYKDQSQEWTDEMAQEASKYAIRPRFAIGFYDLDEKKCIVIDFSKKQAETIIKSIQTNEKRLGNRAFEITKGDRGSIQINPILPDELTDAHQQAFNEAPKEFDKTLFEDLYFVRDEKGMLEALQQAGVDVTKFGYNAPTSAEQPSPQVAEANPFAAEDINEDDLPF